MILLDDFFTVSNLQSEGDTVKALLEINVKHKIFDGHFPGQPVVPGVCMLQIVKEITQHTVNNTLRLVKAEHLKFLALISPLHNTSLNLDLQYKSSESGTITVIASLFHNEITFFKFKGSFITEG